MLLSLLQTRSKTAKKGRSLKACKTAQTSIDVLNPTGSKICIPISPVQLFLHFRLRAIVAVYASYLPEHLCIQDFTSSSGNISNDEHRNYSTLMPMARATFVITATQNCSSESAGPCRSISERSHTQPIFSRHNFAHCTKYQNAHHHQEPQDDLPLLFPLPFPLL